MPSKFLSDLGKNIASQVTKGLSGQGGNALVGPASLLPAEIAKSLWAINGENWYKVYGYQFHIEDKKSDGKANSKYYFTLPIPPQSISVTPVIPAKATPTMGGVVEEHSPVTFWQINLMGTTGVAISRRPGDEQNRQYMAGQFREILSTTGLLAGKFNQLNKAINKIGGIVDNTISTIQNIQDGKNPLNQVTAGVKGVVGAVNNSLLPQIPYAASAVSRDTNGFTEAQELQLFFYVYQQLKSQDPQRYDLYFTIYKTNQRWRTIVRNFSLQQSANEPMSYKYQISLQGWDCKSADKESDLSKAFDRFGPEGDLKTVNTMGIAAHKNGKTLNQIKNRLKVRF